jgi:hypothetical protein
MKCPSLSRALESLALCISAVALVFTVTIAVNVGAMFVEQWPVLWPAAGQPSRAAEPPPASTTRLGPAKSRRRHGHAVRTTVAPAKQVEIDDQGAR